MQCSLGSGSGTSGDDVCGASRSWTGDAILLAWRVQGLPLASAGLITWATNHSSHHRSNNVLTHIAWHGSETLVC